MFVFVLSACGSLGLQTIELGESTEGRITISPAGTVNFGRAVEDGEPEDKTLTLSASGNSVRVIDIWVEGRSGAFALMSEPPVPRSLQDGEEMELRVRFKPGAQGSYSAELIVETQGGAVISRDMKGEGCADRDGDGRCD